MIIATQDHNYPVVLKYNTLVIIITDSGRPGSRLHSCALCRFQTIYEDGDVRPTSLCYRLSIFQCYLLERQLLTKSQQSVDDVNKISRLGIHLLVPMSIRKASMDWHACDAAPDVQHATTSGTHSAGLTFRPSFEPDGQLWSDGKRPDGFTLIVWQGGRCMTWDFTVTDTHAELYLAATSWNSRQ